MLTDRNTARAAFEALGRKPAIMRQTPRGFIVFPNPEAARGHPTTDTFSGSRSI